MNSLVLRRARGFTLIELLITIALTVVLLTLGVPSMKSFFDRERLISATEQIYSHLQQARIEAIARSADVYTNIITSDVDGSWSYGVSVLGPCNPAQTNKNETDACVIIVDDGDGVTGEADDRVLMRYDSTQHDSITASVDGNALQITFDSLRGTMETLSGNTISLESEGSRTLDIRIGALGQLSICSPDDNVSGYSQCPAGG
jgi:prepilin-type N-terminal cleavage/methylation domain-containing protein